MRERSQMSDERTRALALLGVGDEESATRLDVEVRRLQTQLDVAKQRAAAAESRAAGLEERARGTVKTDVEDVVKAKDRVINLLQSDLDRAERDAELAQDENDDLTKQIQLMKVELDRYIVRFRCMEKVSNSACLNIVADMRCLFFETVHSKVLSLAVLNVGYYAAISISYFATIRDELKIVISLIYSVLGVSSNSQDTCSLNIPGCHNFCNGSGTV